jgi:hypothetical protein
VAKIFVSYRRDDASSEAGRITDWLDRHFGEDEVFMDINALEPGVDFVEGIEQAVNMIDALIAVIGPGWVDAKDEHGNRRLDDPTDWVRLEIANALRRGIRVIPVLVKGAAMPPEAKLPDDLKPLRRRNALPITERQWRPGIEELIEALDGVVTPAPEPTPQPEPTPPTKTLTLPAFPSWVVLGVLLGAAMILSGVFIRNSGGERFLHPSFGGAKNFDNQSTFLWRLAGVFTTLPTLGIAATAIVALLVAQRSGRNRAACAGAILLCGVQGVVLYAAVLAWRGGSSAGFGVAVVGGLLLCAVMLPIVSRLVAASEASDPVLELWVRATAVLGAVVMVIAMMVDFNNGGPAPDHRHAGAVFEASHPERWDLLAIAVVAAGIGLLAPILRVRPLLGGALVACGVGAVCVWPRFIVIPLIENENVASPGAGGFIGIAGAALILFSGYGALRASQPQEHPAATPELT